uniref:Uncharacterized protein n=1 Tax=Arion vulgaris TaxID=1028688 RepID=A0A0B7AM79_9EUPU
MYAWFTFGKNFCNLNIYVYIMKDLFVEFAEYKETGGSRGYIFAFLRTAMAHSTFDIFFIIQPYSIFMLKQFKKKYDTSKMLT